MKFTVGFQVALMNKGSSRIASVGRYKLVAGIGELRYGSPFR